VNAAEFEHFYLGTRHRLLRYAYGLTGNLAEAQDFTQEAYARAWKRWRRLHRYEEPEAWLRLVVTHLATDRWRWLALRRAQPRPRSQAVEPPNDDRLLVVRALKDLPLNHRRAIAMRYLLDLPITEIAHELGANESTVRSWLARGRASLATTLGDEVHAA
jgi:RNA polymerase sigma-70 factor (ECF subfamily)